VTIALVIDLCFYLTGLAYRDKQVEKDKIIFQEQLIQQLETNRELQEKFTGELEQQVKEKTTEL
jgi:O-phosphoseryl-tRNA(Cys) synthetase